MTGEIQKLYTKRAALYHFFFLDFLGVGRRMEDFFRQSNDVQSHFKILDARCGTGNVTRLLYAISCKRGYGDVRFHAFDFTQAMLRIFQQWIKNTGAHNIVLKQADVLHLELPPDWNGYDRIVSSGMLEYVPKDRLQKVLLELKQLLKYNGKLVIFITKRTILTKLCVEWWWKAHTYDEKELQKIFLSVGFSEYKIVKSWWHFMFVVEARK